MKMMIYCNLLQILSRIIIFTEAFHLAQVLSQAQIDMFCCNFSCSMHACIITLITSGSVFTMLSRRRRRRRRRSKRN
jgi:uncharacterized protein (DUF2062 family)